jgi:hypothetical protein
MRITGVFLLIMVMAAAGCQKHLKNNLPPSEMLMHPGPGVDGPGPGVMAYQPAVPPVQASSQIYFVGPEGLTIQWDVTAPGRFDSEQLVAPARYNFPQGAMYRLKVSNVPGRPGVELYPTLELGFAVPRTEAFLAHNAIPVEFTEEDLDQVMTGNFVTKVIYLPDPEFQELALAGVGTLVSTRLDPGVDPIIEADRRGAIMAIVRLGNKDLQIQSAGAEGGMGGAGGMGPAPCPMPYGGAMPPNFVAGVTAPQYGMPMVGTPIGLPGPPHVPFGVPAGLQSHVMVNRTHVNLPEPTKHEKIVVKQTPGFSYPTPPNRVRIVEHDREGHGVIPQPLHERIQIAGRQPATPSPVYPGGAPCLDGGAASGNGGAPAAAPCAAPAVPAAPAGN